MRYVQSLRFAYTTPLIRFMTFARFSEGKEKNKTLTFTTYYSQHFGNPERTV